MSRLPTLLPEPYWWPEAITQEQYTAFTPETLELIDGYLLDGPEEPERRVKLLALLLANCGLEAAAGLAHPDQWREALEHAWGPRVWW